MSLFRGKGCLYGCLGACAAVIITVLAVAGFGLYKARQSCIQFTVPIAQANETCKLTSYDSTAAEQPAKAQELLTRLKLLSETPGNEVKFRADELQLLWNHIVSHPLPAVATDTAASIAQMGIFFDHWLPNTVTNFSISKDAIRICAVSSIEGSLLSWCPATGRRGALLQASLVPSTETPGQPLAIADAQLNDTKVPSEDVSSFQNGLYSILTKTDADTTSSLLQTFTSKIEKITLEDGSLTLHPKRSPNDAGSAQ